MENCADTNLAYEYIIENIRISAEESWGSVLMDAA